MTARGDAVLTYGDDMIKGAEFSPCRRWRYTLHRIWDQSKPYCQFIGLNPSTADEETNDPTVTRCQGYAERWGYGGLVMTNLFGWRDTDPRGMKEQHDPVGQDNDEALMYTASRAGVVVCAWGNHGAHRGRGEDVRRMLADFPGKPLFVLKLTKQGHPWHPLYLSRELHPTRWYVP